MISLTDLLVVTSNLAVAMVTALLVWATMREEHRHSERETEQIIHLVRDAEKEETPDGRHHRVEN